MTDQSEGSSNGDFVMKTAEQLADEALTHFEAYQEGAFGPYVLDAHQMRLFANEVVEAERAQRRELAFEALRRWDEKFEAEVGE